MDTFVNNPVTPKRSIAAKILVTLLVIILLGAGVVITYLWQQRGIDDLNGQVTDLNTQLDTATSLNQKNMYISTKAVSVKVFTPESGSKAVSPLGVTGLVPGSWSSEASFPVELLDSKGKVVASTTAKVLGDWMSTELVPFSAQLTWTSKTSGDGTLVLRKDNPSDLVANDDSVSIPVKF